MMISKENITRLAQERIDELDKGLYLVDIVINNGSQIQVEIDSLAGGVGIDDCVSVSRNIEHNLDREVQDFELQVSSPGLDKPFKVKQQYTKNIGRDVKVVFKDVGSVEGKLIDADDNGITVQTVKKEKLEGKKKKIEVVEDQKIDFDKIKETKLIISFK